MQKRSDGNELLLHPGKALAFGDLLLEPRHLYFPRRLDPMRDFSQKAKLDSICIL
jgi:hypothetical protein